MSKILKEVNSDITITSNEESPRSGAFEISFNKKLIYSKFQTGKFPTENEVINLIK